MYAKTFLDSSAIAELAKSENPKAYLSLFRESSILLLDRELRRQLSETLPTHVYKRLMHDIEKGRQLMRAIETQPQGGTRPVPDVIVESQPQHAFQPPIRCKLREFDEVPLIERLIGLHRGEEEVRDREEFWKVCLRPVLEGVRSSTPTIEYFDSYVFHDSVRPLKKKTKDGIAKDRNHSGISWLLQKFEQFAAQLDVQPVIHIYSEADKGDMTESDVLQEFEEIAQWLNPQRCSIKVHLFEGKFVDAAVNKKLKHSLHSRTLLINRQHNFSFNYGTRNLGLEFNAATGEYEDQIQRNWTWKPAVSDEWKDFLLYKMTKLVDSAHRYEFV